MSAKLTVPESDLILAWMDKLQACVDAEALPYDGELGESMHAQMTAGCDLDDFVMVYGAALHAAITKLMS